MGAVASSDETVRNGVEEQQGTEAAVGARLAGVTYRILFGVLYVGVFALYLNIFAHQAFTAGAYPSDLPAHLTIARKFFSGRSVVSYPGLYLLWYCMSQPFGINLAVGAVLVDALLVVAMTVIIKKTLEYLKLSEGAQLASIVVLMLVTPIYLPWFNENMYLGTISPNIYHNPTLLGVKPFAYLSVVLFVRWFTTRRALGLYVLAAGALVLSVIMKPNFILAFAPAVAMYLLIMCRGFVARWWKAAMLFTVPICVLAAQYVLTYQQGKGTSHIGLDYLGVWRLYSPDPSISVVISLAFPLCLVVFRWRQVRQNQYLVVSWLALCVGIAEYGLLAEEGIRYAHGNFGWGMQSIVPLVFLFSMVEFARWMKDSLAPRSSYRLNWALLLTTVILGLHVGSGVFYLVRIVSGQSYV